MSGYRPPSFLLGLIDPMRVHADRVAELRDYCQQLRAARAADRADRWRRMSPEAVAAAVSFLRRAGPVARAIPSLRPCDYRPWTEALDRVAGDHLGLMQLTLDAGYGGGWPPDHAHLVDFALTFLEEDPMWFRSGYAKKSLARRLTQARLTECDIARLVPICQRAVTDGTGLEEFKPLCRLAQAVRPPGLWDWLEAQRQSGDERIRRNARYMREDGLAWWRMHRSIETAEGGPGRP